MLRKTHTLFAATCSIAIQNLIPELSLGTGLLFLCGSVIGSSLPDVDTDAHVIRIYEAPFSKIYNFIIVKGCWNFGNEKYIDTISRHRGVTHSLVPLFFFTLFTSLISLLFPTVKRIYLLTFFIGISLGILSHILLDMLNTQGIQLFAPIYTESFICPFSPQITVGGFGEKILSFILFILFVIVFMYRLYNLETLYGWLQ